MSEGQNNYPTAQGDARWKSENILIMNYTIKGYNIMKSPTADTATESERSCLK